MSRQEERAAFLDQHINLPRDQYTSVAGPGRRSETQLADLAPEPLPDLDEAEQVLNDFSLLWRDQSDPEAKRHMLQLVFERVWRDDGHNVLADRRQGTQAIRTGGVSGVHPASSPVGWRLPIVGVWLRGGVAVVGL